MAEATWFQKIGGGRNVLLIVILLILIIFLGVNAGYMQSIALSDDPNKIISTNRAWYIYYFSIFIIVLLTLVLLLLFIYIFRNYGTKGVYKFGIKYDLKNFNPEDVQAIEGAINNAPANVNNINIIPPNPDADPSLNQNCIDAGITNPRDCAVTTVNMLSGYCPSQGKNTYKECFEFLSSKLRENFADVRGLGPPPT